MDRKFCDRCKEPMSEAFYELTITTHGGKQWDGHGWYGEMCEPCYSHVAAVLCLPEVKTVFSRRLINWLRGEMWKTLWQR